jgi:hypothetical protein
MSRVTEQQQGVTSPIRQGIWINRRQWSRSAEAGSQVDLWAALSNPMALRKNVARDFASAIGGRDEVLSVWITQLGDDLEVAVELDDLAVESDLRNVFIDLVCERLDPSEGELSVFPGGSVPDWVQRSPKLI